MITFIVGQKTTKTLLTLHVHVAVHELWCMMV